jgi:hypothetical protein
MLCFPDQPRRSWDIRPKRKKAGKSMIMPAISRIKRQLCTRRVAALWDSHEVHLALHGFLAYYQLDQLPIFDT